MNDEKEVKKNVPLKLLLTLDFKTFFNPFRLDSYRTFINFFILIGGRGIGKTTGYEYKLIENWKKTGEEFVYLRRYRDETIQGFGGFQKLYSGIDKKGIGVRGCYQMVNNNKRIGYGITLSMQAKCKSGIDFSNVKYLLFDEALIKETATRRYLTNEIHEFLELVSSIFRLRKDYYVFIIANNMDIVNPYFEYFNVPLFENKYVDKEKGLYCEINKTNPALLELEKTTPLYKLTQGTAYANYHYENKPLIKNDGKIGTKNVDDTLLIRFAFNNYTMNIYLQRGLNIFVESRYKRINDNITITVTNSNNELNYLSLKEYKSNSIKKFIENAYNENHITYSDNTAIGYMLKLLEITIIK